MKQQSDKLVLAVIYRRSYYLVEIQHDKYCRSAKMHFTTSGHLSADMS